MKYRLMVALLTSLFALGAQARDTELHLSIDEAMASTDAKAKLDSGVKFFFANQKTPAIEKSFGEDSTNKKTNAFGKSDEEACRWAFLSAMIQLQNRARQLGADAVVDIESFYKRDAEKSATDYECHAGAVLAGVALKGRFVKLAAKRAEAAAPADASTPTDKGKKSGSRKRH
ncbi:hypothetical protein [Niveibacterium terrae]|uniref:hypothetical protein n=1 Tax=Niveibacterium terrae TaxID=3373598 RepID=UPI003A959FD0